MGMKTSVNLNGSGNLNGRGSESTEIFVKTLTGKTIALGSGRRAPSNFGLSATMNADEAVSRGVALKIKDPTARVQDDQGPKTIPTARVQREIFVKNQQRSSSRR